MSTTGAAAMGGDAHDHAPASRIVRIGRTAAPWLVGLAVLVTVALAVPRDAWLPRSAGPVAGAAWEVETPPALDAVVALQVALGGWAWPSDVVAGAMAIAAACAAASAALMTVALRRAGLQTGLAALLALVAAAAPFAGWSASSPLGAAPVTLAAVMLLTWLAGHRDGSDDTSRGAANRTRLAALVGLALALAMLAAPGEAGARARDPSILSVTRQLLRADLGLIGLVLLVAGAATFARTASWSRLWLGVGAAWLVTLPLPAEIRVAAMLPWAWWFIGVGVSAAIGWRGGGARWAGAGLMAWLALQVAARPWGHERQEAALVGTWARAMAEQLTATHPLITDRSPRGRLLSTLVAQRTGASSIPATILPRDAHTATEAGRHPVALTTAQRETLRWSGLAFAPWNAGAGASIEAILDALPRGTVTLVVISAESAGRVSPRQWQALGRVGLRLPDAATGRAHALVGITGARVEGRELAQAGAVRLDVQPGDPIGRTAARSPIDARLDASGTRVSIWLRGQAFLDQVEGMALVFFTTRGELLGWRAGADPAHLDGPALGAGPATSAMAVAALPCLSVPAGRETDVTALAALGALGVTWTAPSRVDVRLERPRGWPPSVVRLADTTPDASRPFLIDAATGDRAFAVQGRTADVAGVYFRGPVSTAQAHTTHDVRLCAAWPMPLALAPRAEPIEMPVAPRYEPHFGSGWHEMEVQPGVGYFRWMSGPRADVLIAVQNPVAFTFALDAQAPLPPQPGDQVRLSIAGRDLGARPLFPTRGIYSWDIPAAAVGEGVTTLTFDITRTARPAQAQAGDARELGLLVRGWTISASTPQ